MIPSLAGVHHLKLPVSDLRRSIEWYHSRLGYDVDIEFTEDGVLAGVAMRHSNGGPLLGLRQDPEKATAAAGFDYFSIGVPDKAAIEALAEHLTSLGEAHAGVQFGSLGWVLPLLRDPDGFEVRFYTLESHTEIGDGEVLTVDNAVRNSAAREREYLAGQGDAAR